jgi:ABC-type phosphate/phosphonate transport system permease subunit
MANSENKYHYIPGTCNIGPKEISIRKKASVLAAIFCIVFVILMLMLDTHKAWRLVLFFPAAAFGVTFQQWYYKFCVAFGMKGIFNFGDLGKSFTIEQKEDYAKDRMKALKMIVVGMLFGLICSIFFYLFP